MLRMYRVTVALTALSLLVTGAAVSAQSGTSALMVTDAWARPSTMPGMPGAAYLTIQNGAPQDEVLIAVTSPAAGTVEMHESKDDGSGQMLMSPVESVTVPANGAVTFAPGGYHLMLIDLVQPLQAGGTIDLTLTFQSGATGTATAEVRDTPPMPMGSPVPAGTITVDGAWARTSPMVAMAGAAYLTIHNGGTTDDALVGVTSLAAGTVETHETKDDGTGQMVMSPVASIAVPAGGSVELKPGGDHLMLIDLVEPLQLGGTIDLALTFQSGTVVTVTAEVRDGAPMPMGSPVPAA